MVGQTQFLPLRSLYFCKEDTTSITVMISHRCGMHIKVACCRIDKSLKGGLPGEYRIETRETHSKVNQVEEQYTQRL